MTAPKPTERDPVCGMNVNSAAAKHVHEHAGTKHYFCCASCLQKFKANPQSYLAKPASPGLITPDTRTAAELLPSHHAAHAPATAPGYVCPMCSEVRQTRPGACPACGMALESELPLASRRTEY